MTFRISVLLLWKEKDINMLININPNNPWDLQDWETAEEFNIFTDCYLALKNPRNIRDAYEKYLTEVRGLSSVTAKRTPLSPDFTKMAGALDKDGNKIPDALSWYERGLLFDDEKFKNFKDQIKGAQLNTISGEILDVNELNEHWKELYKEFVDWCQFARLQAKSNGIPYNPDKEINRLEELINIRERIAQFERRAVGLPTKYNELPMPSDQNNVFKLEWKEPVYKKPSSVEEVNDLIKIIDKSLES